MVIELSAIGLLLVFLLLALRRNTFDGFCFGVVLLISLPTYLRVTLPDPLPALTIQRLVLLVLLWWCFRLQLFASLPNGGVILKARFLTWVIAASFSVVFTSAPFLTSLKDFLDVVFEVVLFYLIGSAIIRNQEMALKVFRAVWLGFLIVAVFAVLEKYTAFNPVYYVLRNYDRPEKAGAVISTLPHRILLGTAMSMAWPIAYLLTQTNANGYRISRRIVWISVPLFIAACYFSMSRGPWLASILAGLVLMVLGTGHLRARLLVICLLGVMILVAKPGVLGTLSGMAEATVDAETGKGGTFRYRLELWKIAFEEINRSPLRLLVGYGLGAGREADLQYSLSYRDRDYAIESWDNHFAYTLYQGGFLGLAASLFLLTGVLTCLIQAWRSAEGADRDTYACVLASAFVMLFMMTNVLIFAKQLNFAFWSIFLAGVAYSGAYPNPGSEASLDNSDYVSK